MHNIVRHILFCVVQAEDPAACCSSSACVEAFPVQLRAGAVWVWPDSSPSAARNSSLVQPSVDTVLEVRATFQGGHAILPCPGLSNLFVRCNFPEGWRAELQERHFPIGIAGMLTHFNL